MDQKVSSLAYGNYQMPIQCFIRVKVNFEKKKSVLCIEKFPSIVLARNAIMLQHLLQFSLHYLLSGRLREVKNKRKFSNF